MSAASLSNELLYNIFASTLSADKGVREAAEQVLSELSSQHPDLVLHLLRFACAGIPNDAGGYLGGNATATSPAQAQQRNVLLAAAIRVRNVLGRADWNRNPYFTDDVKIEVRQLIVPLQCQPHVSEHVRRQLLDTTKELMLYDYPSRWPGLIAQLNNLLDGWVAALRSALRASGNNPSSDQVTSVMLQLKGGLGVLRACCKIYEDPLRVDAADVDSFAGLFLPSLVPLSDLFLDLWRGELYRLQAQQPMMDLAGLGNMFEFTPILTELSHCMRLILKCSWSFLTMRMPKCLCDVQAFQAYWMTCLATPLDLFHEVYLPLCLARLRLQAHSPDQSDEARGDHFTVFQDSALWKHLKWIYTIAYKLVQEFMEPKGCEKRVRAVAVGFRDTYLLTVVQYALTLVRWHACRATDDGVGTTDGPVLLLTSKAYIMALEVLTSAVNFAPAYTTFIHPVAEELMTGLLFPRLAFSIEDAELWQFNPEEYVRKQSSPVGDLFSAKVVSASCLLSLAVPTSKFHDKELLGSLVNFLVNQLQIFSQPASQAVSEEESGSAAMEAARRVDAALFCIYQFKKVLASMHFGDDKLEFVLVSFVVPATCYPLGFLRARAVLVLSVFAPSITWSSPQAYQAALQSVLPLLNDAETPVRVQTCVSFSRLIRHPYAREVVTPCIAQLIHHYFDVMRLMDNETVVRTLRKTIDYYSESLSQWGLELADMLVAHFHTVLRNVSSKCAALESSTASGTGGNFNRADCLEDDAFADVLMAADELLDTLTTLVRALPSSAENTEANIFAQLQHRISPMLLVILSHQSGSVYGFMNLVLQLLTTLLSRSPRVVAPTWRLVPCLHQLILSGGALDYFDQMLAPLDNYVSVAPLQFLFVPLQALCTDDNNKSNESGISYDQLGQYTPLQLVQQMAAGVLQNAQQLRGSELSAVPKLYDALMQNVWLLRGTASGADLQEFEQQQQQGLVGAAVSATAQQLISYIGVDPLSQGRRSLAAGTLRVLFSNAVFSCVLADAAAALQTLATMNAIGSFYEQYTLAVLGAPDKKAGRSKKRHSYDGVLSCMRSYDKSVFVLSFCETVKLLLSASAAAWSPAHDTLLATLTAVIHTTIFETFAREEMAAGEKEINFLEKRTKKLARKHGKDAELNPRQQHSQQQAGEGGVGGEEDWEDDDDDDKDAWEDGDSSGSDEMDDTYGFNDDDDDDDENDEDDGNFDYDEDDEGAMDCCSGGGLGFGSEDAAYFAQNKKLQSMLQQAQQLRCGGKSTKARKAAAAADTVADAASDEYEDILNDDEDSHGNAEEQDDDDDANLLDEEEEEFTSPVDAVNVWAVLLDEVVGPVIASQHQQQQQQQQQSSPAVALVDALGQHNAGDIFMQTRQTVDRRFAARAALAAVTNH